MHGKFAIKLNLIIDNSSSSSGGGGVVVVSVVVARILLALVLLFAITIFANTAQTTTTTTTTTSEKRISSRVVRTKYGGLRGFIVTLPNKNLQPVEVFLGIPYASPPIGKLRFMPPVTPAIWSGTRSAHIHGHVCPQKLLDLSNETEALKSMTTGRLNILRRLLPTLQNQSEDCLYLNIYAPAVVGREPIRLPVLMFIHGESYEWNAGSSYDGSVLASYANFVVVTINYRIGVLGFFPSLDGTARGNFGLMDQVAALHWIQENIKEFGGDETNVTIMGHGHGAACVNFLMLSPMAKGLFHRVIMQSGSALSPWAIASDAVIHARNLAKALRCPSDADKNAIMVDCLRQRTAEEIVSVDFKVPTHLTAFGPVIDGIVIPGDPTLLMSDSHSYYGNYDLLFGVTKIESYNQFTLLDERHGIDPTRRDRLLRTLVRNLFSYHLQEIFLTIVNEYTDWTRPVFHPISTFDSIAESFGDALIVAPIIRVGLMHAKLKLKRKTYFYNFAYQTEEGEFNSRSGCIHGQELAYIFGAPLVNGYQLSWFTKNYTRSETTLSESVMTFWTNFAKSGDPNIIPSVDDKNSNSNSNNNNNKGKDRIVWPQYDDMQQQYLTLTLKPKTRDHYHAHRLSYWLNLLPQLHTPGPSSAEEHHLLEAHDDPLSYDGVVRDITLTGPIPIAHYFTTQSSNEINIDATAGHYQQRSTNSGVNATNIHASSSSTSTASVIVDKTHQQSALDSGGARTYNATASNASVSMIVQPGSYSTALSVTIAIGCSLLILNVLVFAGVFYQRDKNRLEAKLVRKNYQVQKIDELSMTKNPSSHSPLRHHGDYSDHHHHHQTQSTVNSDISGCGGAASDYVHGLVVGSATPVSQQKHSHSANVIISQQQPHQQQPHQQQHQTSASSPVLAACHVPNRSAGHVSMANSALTMQCNLNRNTTAAQNVINTGRDATGTTTAHRHSSVQEMRV